MLLFFGYRKKKENTFATDVSYFWNMRNERRKEFRKVGWGGRKLGCRRMRIKEFYFIFAKGVESKQ